MKKALILYPPLILAICCGLSYLNLNLWGVSLALMGLMLVNYLSSSCSETVKFFQTLLSKELIFKKESPLAIIDETNTLNEATINQIRNYTNKIIEKFSLKNFPTIVIKEKNGNYFRSSTNQIALNVCETYGQEWKAVLAHEIGHYHTQEKYLEKMATLLINFLLASLAISLYFSPSTTFASITILDIASIFALKYIARKSEFESDLIAHKIAGDKIIKYLKKLKDPRKFDILDTHPLTTKRIANLEKNTYKESLYKPEFTDYINSYVLSMIDFKE